MSTDHRADDLSGVRLGSYLLDARIGRGSMAEVYRARDVLTQTEVALKVHSRKDNEPSRRRFQQEARAVSLLRHPGVVEVYEVGVDGELSFIAMELVDGPPLSTVMQAGALPWQEAVTVGIEIADALAHAHEAGVMHRDLKPSNVLVSQEGRIKLVDFGLAKRVGSVPDAGDGATVWDWAFVHTQPGAVLGTPAYMAPEQARAAEVDARADVFALGVILWEAIAHEPLFRRATPAATLRAILTEPAPELDKVVTDVPRALAAIVQRALEKQPAQRFAHAGELGRALRALPGAGERQLVVERVTQRHSETLSEPPFVGRARELVLAVSALESAQRSVTLVGLPGSGRRRLALAALEATGCTRSLHHAWSHRDTLAKAFHARAYDSLLLDIKDEPAAPIASAVRAVLGPRTRFVLLARQGTPPDPASPPGEHRALLPTVDGEVRVRGMPTEEAITLLSRASKVRIHGELLAGIGRAVGGHAQSITALSLRLLSENALDLASQLEQQRGWPESLAALGALRAWLAQQTTARGPRELAVLTALAAVPSATERLAHVIAEDALARRTDADARPAFDVLASLAATPLLEAAHHPARIGVARVAVPALVRRVLFDQGDAAVRARAQEVALGQLAERADVAARRHLEEPDEDAAAELLTESESILELAGAALAHDPRSSSADDGHLDRVLRALVALAETDVLERGSERARALDLALARALGRGATSPPLRLRALVARLAAAPPLIGNLEPTATGEAEALALAERLEDAGASARLDLARLEREAAVAEDPRALLSPGLERVLDRLEPTLPKGTRQQVLADVAELHIGIGALGAARGALRNALSLATERRDARGESRLLHRLARLSLLEGDVEAALQGESAALPGAIAVADATLSGLIECSLAELVFLSGDPERARAHVDRAAQKGASTLSRAALTAGHIELAAGHPDRARALYTAACAHAESHRDLPAVAVGQAALAATFAARGDRPASNDALVRATLAARALSLGLRAVVLGWRGHFERALGGHDEPDAVFRDRALARFDGAAPTARGESEAGTGPAVGRAVLIATFGAVPR